ncbi:MULTISPECIES: NERD domain-containing protein [unclassified Pseudomonas]|uniref:nuclease-related domain-containing protein n=1 Tax=unclassified Pseudomonas TaxID=196821 RepID=UPI000731577C|nr:MULTISPECIES: NERD domain-containing protein [unclassified Pseudomonas]KSW24322.1 nuclease [Pseudomonas sp. ADP]OBP11251.1 nuclease [Pseudomonas sp. EGD-AKN5]QOF86883.1 NERD domain-containing protein [Pseudomonas sp. ADPe]
MDFTPITAQIWSVTGWLIPFMLVIGLLKSPWAKGQIGELLVRLFAHWQLDQSTYRRLHNVTLNTPDGTTQIDHVFLSPYGIFVLETKNMSGWIFGTEKQAQWTQKIYKRTYKFQNPLRQNYKHLKALEATLQVDAVHLHSVITFVGGSTFMTEVPACVTLGIGFIDYIKSFQKPVFSQAEVDAMLELLQSGRRSPSLATHREHLQNLKRRSDPTAERLCPKCGSALVIRTRKAGPKAGQQFWGCSGFPRCRIIQDL